MKARDLATLAALGVAGYAAYNKFGKKDAPASGTRAGAKLGESGSANDGDSGEREARMNMRDMNEGSGRRDAGGNTEDYSNEGRRAKFADEDYSNKGRSAKFTNEDFSNEGRGKTAPVAVAKPVRTPVVTRSVAAAPAAPAAANAVSDYSNEGRNAKAPVNATFSSTAEGMAANVPRRTVSDYSNEGRNAKAPVNATFSSTAEGMAAYVPRRPGQTTPQATSSSTAEGMAAYVPRNTAATAQAKLDALRASGGRRAKGGVVKMASGGMASSKMSKPSGASRGDGIAQRGRTRGTLR